MLDAARIDGRHARCAERPRLVAGYSTVTVFARLRG
jgi:hypothetical protein